MRTGQAVISCARRALGLAGPVAASAASSGTSAGAPATHVRAAPASPHLLFHSTAVVTVHPSRRRAER
jgi:hypothetical protein